MKLTEKQVLVVKQLLDKLNEKFKNTTPFTLVQEQNDEYSLTFSMPKFGINLKISELLDGKINK